MFTLFIAGLVLLVALFAVKLMEIKTGRTLFLARFRRRADQFVLSWWRRLRANQQGFFTRSKYFVSRKIRVLRHRLATWLSQLSDYLRE